MMEALVCHPLGKTKYPNLTNKQSLTWITDTIKVRMQLSRRARAPGVCSNPYQPSKSDIDEQTIGESTRLPYHGQGDCGSRNGPGII